MNKIAYFYPTIAGEKSPVLDVPVPTGTSVTLPLSFVVMVIIDSDASNYYCDVTFNDVFILRSTLINNNLELPGGNHTSGFVTKFNLQNVEPNQHSILNLQLKDRFDNIYDESEYHMFFYEVSE